MSASSVSLLPDDAGIAKAYLPMTQTALIEPNHMNFSLVNWLALSASPLSKFQRCLRHRGTNLSDEADIGMKF
jgi:hypothetical protein